MHALQLYEAVRCHLEAIALLRRDACCRVLQSESPTGGHSSNESSEAQHNDQFSFASAS
jgi:hypothetical protein